MERRINNAGELHNRRRAHPGDFQSGLSQEHDQESSELTSGISLGLGGGVSGIAADVEFGVPISNRMVTARYLAMSEVRLDGVSRPKELREYGILAGLLKSSSSSFQSISLGLSYVVFEDWSSTQPTEMTVGIPLEAQLLWRPSHNFSFGFIGFGNINSYHPYGGIVFCIRLG